MFYYRYGWGLNCFCYSFIWGVFFYVWGFYISVWFDKLSFKNKYLCINMCIKNEIVKGDGGWGVVVNIYIGL